METAQLQFLGQTKYDEALKLNAEFIFDFGIKGYLGDEQLCST